MLCNRELRSTQCSFDDRETGSYYQRFTMTCMRNITIATSTDISIVEQTDKMLAEFNILNVGIGTCILF